MAGFSRHYFFMINKINDPLTEEFKGNLALILEQRKQKTSLKQLSLEAGLGETAVRDILKGRSNSPRLETVYKLSKALKVPVYRLIPSMIDQSYDELESLRTETERLKNG